MRRTVLAGVLLACGCIETWDRPPRGHDELWQAARDVLGEEFRITYSNKDDGIVEADSLVSANLFGKYRTRVVAQVVPRRYGSCELEVRVIHEYESAAPSLINGRLRSYDWVALAYDDEREAALLNRIYERASRSGASTARVSSPSAPPTSLSKDATHLALIVPGREPSRQTAELLLLGDLDMGAGRTAEALKKYRAAAELEPLLPLCHLALADGLIAAREFDKAAGELPKAFEGVARPQLLDLRKLYGAQWEQIKTEFATWFNGQAARNDARLLWGYFYAASGSPDGAAEVLRPLDDPLKAKIMQCTVRRSN